jgi:hypothetical protein
MSKSKSKYRIGQRVKVLGQSNGVIVSKMWMPERKVWEYGVERESDKFTGIFKASELRLR